MSHRGSSTVTLPWTPAINHCPAKIPQETNTSFSPRKDPWPFSVKVLAALMVFTQWTNKEHLLKKQSGWQKTNHCITALGTGQEPWTSRSAVAQARWLQLRLLLTSGWREGQYRGLISEFCLYWSCRWAHRGPRQHWAGVLEQPVMLCVLIAVKDRIFTLLFYRPVGNCLDFWIKHLSFCFAGVSSLSPGWSIAVGSAFPIYCVLLNLFQTLNFQKKSLIKAELGKCKSEVACRSRYIWTHVCV